MNTITIVSQLISEARLRFGEVEAVEVPPALWEPTVDEVAAAGGEVGLDHCRVDGVAVRLSERDEPVATFRMAGGGGLQQLPIAG